jgi:hypothetical protein
MAAREPNLALPLNAGASMPVLVRDWSTGGKRGITGGEIL